MLCEKCNIEVESKFCPNCGTKTISFITVPNEQPAISKTTLKKKNKTLYAIVFMFVALLLIIVFIFTFLKPLNASYTLACYGNNEPLGINYIEYKAYVENFTPIDSSVSMRVSIVGDKGIHSQIENISLGTLNANTSKNFNGHFEVDIADFTQNFINMYGERANYFSDDNSAVAWLENFMKETSYVDNFINSDNITVELISTSFLGNKTKVNLIGSNFVTKSRKYN